RPVTSSASAGLGSSGASAGLSASGASAGLSASGAPARLGAADAFGGNLLAVARGAVGTHRVGSQALLLADLREQRAHIGVVGVHEDLVRAEHVTGQLGLAEGAVVDQQRLGGGLLNVHHRADLGG